MPQIYGHGTKGTAGAPPPKAWARYPKPLNNVSPMDTAPDEDHVRQRKIFTPAFSDRALKQQEPLFLKYINKLVDLLKKSTDENPDRKIDLVRVYNFTTFDIMGDLTFGESLHMLDNAEYDPWVSAIPVSVKYGSMLRLLAMYPYLLRLWKTFAPPSFGKASFNHFNHSVTRVTKRLEKGRQSEGIDLWDLVLSQKEGQGLSRSEMDSHAAVFMIAGTETTATLVSGLTYLLLANPDCMKKVCEEVRGAFETEANMDMEEVAALSYLSACIKEALRLYPPAPIGFPRLTPEIGSTVNGSFIPPGTILSIPTQVLQTSPQHFTRSTEFLPQRWLGDPEFADDKRYCVQPFSVGSRDCIGKK